MDWDAFPEGSRAELQILANEYQHHRSAAKFVVAAARLLSTDVTPALLRKLDPFLLDGQRILIAVDENGRANSGLLMIKTSSTAEIVVLGDRPHPPSIQSTKDLRRLLLASPTPTGGKIFSGLPGCWPSCIMELLQFEITHSLDSSYKRLCLRHLRSLSKMYGILPPSFILHDVVRAGNDAVCGGGFADVWKGCLNGHLVCLKCPRLFLSTTEENRRRLVKQFCREALVWKQLNHPNVLAFLGVNMELFAPRFCLISPWMSNGTLLDYLEKNPEHNRMKALLEVAEGMNYLHTFDPVIVHADIRGANILVTDQLICCLADFGLATAVESQQFTSTSLNSTGTVRWMAPELFLPSSRMQDRPSRDIYAFGCTILEISTSRSPFDAYPHDVGVISAVVRGERPSRPREISSDTLWNLVAHCWETEPCQRPLSKDVVSSLRTLNESNLVAVPETESSLMDHPLSRPPLLSLPPPSSDRERLRDQREPKRRRLESGRPDIPSPGSIPKLPRLGNPSSSTSLPPVLPPHPHLIVPHRPPPTESGGTASASTNSDQQVVSTTSTGGFPDDLDIHTLPAEYKQEGTDWFAISNPKQKRVMDVQLVHVFMHESVVACVRFSADGKYLATGCNRTAQIYDVKTGIKTCVLSDETASKAGDLYIRSVCFSPDSKYLATGAEDKQIRIWDIAKRRIRNVFDGHQQEIYSLDFSHDGRLIASGSGDMTVRIWDMLDGSVKVLTIHDPYSLNNDAGVTSVAISPNGQLVATGSFDTVVRIWDVPSGTLVERLGGHKDSVYSVAFTPDGKGLISGSLDKTLKYWDVSGLLLPGGVEARKEATAAAGAVTSPNGGKTEEKASPCTMNFTGHKDHVLSVAVSHDGRWVVSGSKDRGVQFWDPATAAVQCLLQGHKNSVISVDLSPGGNILATGSGDREARIWAYSST